LINTDGTETIACDLCGADNPRSVGHFSFCGRELALVRCARCGLGYTSPRLAPRERAAFFKGYLTGTDEDYERWEASRRVINAHALELMGPPSGGETLLDVGCGYGLFLEAARAAGYAVSGVEVSKAACAYVRRVRGLEPFCGTLEQAGFPDQSFDAMTLFDVVGYLPSPMAALREARRVLRPGGLLVLKVMDRLGYLRAYQLLRVFGPRQERLDGNPFLQPDRHVYFTARTLAGYLEKLSFVGMRVYGAPLVHFQGEGMPVRAVVTAADMCMRAVAGVTGQAVRLSPSMLVVARRG